MKRKRPKGGWTRQAEKALRSAAAATRFTGEMAERYVLCVAAVCARNKIAFCEATPELVLALIKADPALLPPRTPTSSFSHTALWMANFGGPWPIREIRKEEHDMFAQQWAQLALETTHRMADENQKKQARQWSRT